MRINDPKCVNKTFPGYFDAFAKIATPVPVLAIDGPSASGKGTVAARVAEALGWHYLDSGSLYRLVALAAMRAGVAARARKFCEAGRRCQNTSAESSPSTPITPSARRHDPQSVSSAATKRPLMPPSALPAMYKPIARAWAPGAISSPM